MAGAIDEQLVIPQIHFRWDRVLPSLESIRLTVAWWFTTSSDSERAVRDQLKDPDSQLSIDVTWQSRESFLVWPRFKMRTLKLRAKRDASELVSWGTTPYSR